ncbi:acyl-CoA dehydrogenase family protein [Thauera humireducens]|uniref:Acyl-CoA dehydrogenase n=1 Tax=Thauera humireducens TaxID=1134435 RepID=A0A127K4Q8_9RHOO|nr:acyl-CoA dehydrogenase family protein [Thauera humireducens]AMO36947.1 acyl-CoA dehydrogenase [Thauera humireducens]
MKLSDEQRALQETAADFLAAHTNARKETDADAELWSRIVELGWAAVQVPEDLDGLGLGPVELVLLMEEMGRRLARTPFLANVVLAQTALLQAASAEAQQRALTALAYGERTATLILGPGLDAEPASLTVKARRDGDGWVLAGEAAQVLDDGLLTHAYVAARIEEAPGVALFELAVDAAGLSRTPLEVWDLTRPQARWCFDEVRLTADARVDDPARVLAGLARTRVLAALQLAAEQVGGAAQCLQLAVDYTKERVQFGKPVASFQAVKHRVAEMMVRMETARSTVLGVASRVAQGAQGSGLDDAALAAEIAAARVQASEAYRYCAQEAIQLHGGVGFTWEYDPQMHFKRAQWASQWFGPTRDWREALAAHLLDAA